MQLNLSYQESTKVDYNNCYTNCDQDFHTSGRNIYTLQEA